MTGSDQNWPLLIEFGKRLISETSSISQANLIIELLQDILDCQAYVVISDTLVNSSHYQTLDWGDTPQIPKDLMINAVESRKTGIHSVIDPTDANSSFINSENIKDGENNAISTPVSFNEKLLGVCAAIRAYGSFFLPHEIDLLEYIASYSAVIIYSNSKINADRKKFELLTLVREVGSQIAQLDSLDVLSDRITRIIQKTFHYYYVAIFTVEEEDEILNFRSSTAAKDSIKKDIHHKLESSSPSVQPTKIEARLGEGIIGNVAQNGIEIIANDVMNNPYYRYTDVLPETRSEAAFPIKMSNKILGVLDVQSDKTNAFQEEDLLVLRWLSDHIAVGLENSRLYVDSQRHLTQLKSIYDVSNAITSVLNFDELLEQVIRLMQQDLGYSSVHFYTFNPTRGEIIYQRGGDGKKQISFDGFSLSIDNEESSVAWVARNKNPLIVKNVDKESNYISDVPAGGIVQSELVVPLLFAGDLLGVLKIQSDQPDYFSEDDLFLVEALADNIAIALRNSNLYRSEQWRRRVADSLREVAGLLSADISLDQVLVSILSELINTIPSVIAAIWLLDEEYESTEADSDLRLSALIHSPDFYPGIGEKSIDLESILGLSIGELIDNYKLDTSVKSWLSEVVTSETPIIRDSSTPSEPIGALLELKNDYSAIAAPLRIGERSLGILTLIHDQTGRYGESSQLLSATFANYASVAIENTRLYEAAHDQAWVSTVLLQVTQAMQSIDSMDDLLQTIVSVLPDLIGASSCAILLWDEHASSFVPGIAHGFSDEQFAEFENWYIGEFEVPAFDEIRVTKAPVFMDQSRISESNLDLYFKSFDISNGLYVLFPMITQNEVIGTVLVDFREADNQLPGEVSLWEEKISIIQGVSNQAAIAIENIQLIKAQEEEAYVSIALLQVAQAIVSSNNLDEILSTIVRITPILVGVRRSIIFLWDEAHQIFRVSQAYGFDREELSKLQPFYSTDEFPLLDYVCKNNKLVYHSTIDPLDPFQWSRLTVEDISSVNSINREGEVDSQQLGLLQSEFPLLMGFPLAVKDTVLGIMLIEEIDQKSNVPSYHIREKRLEIVTGITQQAAIAIQNEILQREVLERERLEREMQLARDIQSTFLPDQLPVIDGWDLDVRWRPARQVGGDFYDVFELPDNQLGIVIADVADKGMPAALYMTLVRTLIRAAIHDHQTPSEVLQRVNNLLVPDSRQGMFVTLVYAVIALETGQVTIANAGHNPPLSLNTGMGKITEHKRNAMALGVFHDIEIEESQTLLDRGDLFLMYTDGITEAFSYMDELFGLDRLKEIILNSHYNSASALLDHIESSVMKFSDGLSQSDDVTLVALYRKVM